MPLVTSLKKFVRASAAGRVALLPLRLRLGVAQTGPDLLRLLRWLRTSREHTNLTYDLDALNREYLAFFLSACLGITVEEVRGYLDEVEQDHRLPEHIRQSVRNGPARAVSDEVARYGRRLGWYAIVRARKPRLVVETGVDKGLGSCVIAAALEMNAREGAPGECMCLDINPAAGYLITGAYANFARMIVGDSIESLKNITTLIDVFISDSDHSASHEAAEYEVIAPKLSPKSVLVSDNAHVTPCLAEFAERTSRRFLYFQEQPQNHWFRGAGIGIAF